jgi:thioredoxin-related protein
MKKAVLLLIFFSPLILFAQSDSFYKGIKWADGLSWEQVKQKAKEEGKYIFVEAYATWCGPCKLMDKNVYPDEKVGACINQKFISIKLQIDTSNHDDENAKWMYADASELRRKYDITAFPTLLFFSSEGQLLHRALGYRNASEFITLASAASDPQKQFYTLLDEYKTGKKNYSLLPYMIEIANQVNEKEWEQTLARDYIENCLYNQKENNYFKIETLGIIGTYMRSSNEKGFKFFYRNQNKINELLGLRRYAQDRIENIIFKEEVSPSFEIANQIHDNPNWDLIHSNIKKKYGNNFSEHIVFSAQFKWYNDKKDWQALAKYNIEKVERLGLDTVGLDKAFTNNMIWQVYFLHCNDIEQLEKAIKWMEILVKDDPYYGNGIDTYANLLYKAGHIKEAIKWETIAAKLSPEDKSIQEALGKMNNGEATYVKNGAIWDSNTLPKLGKKVLKNN